MYQIKDNNNNTATLLLPPLIAPFFTVITVTHGLLLTFFSPLLSFITGDRWSRGDRTGPQTSPPFVLVIMKLITSTF